MSIEPFTYVEIDLEAIRWNLGQIQRKVSPTKVMAAVKADAYGHGLLEVAELAVAHGVEHFGVARPEEGIQLRKHGIEASILVFGGFFDDNIDQLLQHDLELTLFDLPRARLLSDRARRRNQVAKVHIKVDTGMGRVGVPWQQVVDFTKQILELENIEVVAVYTHFAASDSEDKTFAVKQLQRFKTAIDELEKEGIRIPLKHAANSGAVLDMPDSYFDLVRPGVSLYGYYPSLETSGSIPLKPAMRVKSRVIAIKEVQAETPISYNMTYHTKERTKIATVSIGYGDGYNRLLSNKGEALIGGRRYPVVGRVCMDQITVDVGPDSAVEVGDEVVLLGPQGREEITIWEMCNKLNTIPYEVTCWFSARLPKVFIKN